MEAFGFEGGPEGFHGGVVVAVGASAHAGGDAVRVQERAEGGRCVLAAAIGMVECGQWGGEGRAVKGTLDEGALHGGTGFPADNASGAEVHFRSQVMPAFEGGQVGDVGDPGLLGRDCGFFGGGQEPIGGDGVRVAAVGRSGSVTALAQGAQPVLGH